MSYYLQAALIFFALIAVNIVYGGSAHAKGVYQTEDAFLHDVFGDNVPQKQSILLRSDVRESVEKILNLLINLGRRICVHKVLINSL